MSKITWPAEWHLQESIWLAWPAAADLWQDDLRPAQAEFCALINFLREPNSVSTQSPPHINLLVHDKKAQDDAKRALGTQGISMFQVPYGDIWLRDTGPIFVQVDGQTQARLFEFNGWGEKYVLDHDDQVNSAIQHMAGVEGQPCPVILEGGSLDNNGQGTVLSTRQCLLNPNRNSLTEKEWQRILRETLGVEHIIWIDEGLLNDHTDGHIDNIARFVAPNKVVCMHPSGDDDPNYETYHSIRNTLQSSKLKDGTGLEVVEIPSPGLLTDEEGDVIPASFMNFLISNHVVAVPTYGTPHDQAAVGALSKLFPNHLVRGFSSKFILTGGGSFHCISQQQPTLKEDT